MTSLFSIFKAAITACEWRPCPFPMLYLPNPRQQLQSGEVNEIFPWLQFFYTTSMLSSDCLMEVTEATAIQNTNMIRKTLFDITINDTTYPDTISVLTDNAIFFCLRKNQSDVHIKISFTFQLLFQVIMTEQNNFNFKTLHSIRLERSEKYIIISSHKNIKELQVWREYFEKNFNQKGFHELFKAVKKIGKGSFATVYLVKKIEDQKQYAVKAFSKAVLYAERKGKESLINEIEVMRKFSHKQLIKIYGVYETDHSIYIVIELLNGGILSDKFAKKYRFSSLQIKVIMKSILQGLQAMHKRNIMHRDLKPQNILIRNDKTCECVIGDFGLSQHVNSQDYLFVRCGTPGFVAPEIVNLKDKNMKYNQSCDLFSLGVIFHMLLLRKSPFIGKEYNEILSQNKACSFNFDSYDYRQLPEESVNLLQRLLQKDPNKRISASEALKHSFFYSQFTIWENNKKFSLTIDENSNIQNEPPLIMARSNERKKITHIRGDSCLKFKANQSSIMENSCEMEEKSIVVTNPPEIKSSLKKTGTFGQNKLKKVTINK